MSKHVELPVQMEAYDGRVVDANGDYVPTNELVDRYNDHARLVAALREARNQIIELCQTYGNPLPEASISRYNQLLAELTEGDCSFSQEIQ